MDEDVAQVLNDEVQPKEDVVAKQVRPKCTSNMPQYWDEFTHC